MRRAANGASFFVLLSMAIILSLAVSAQDPVQTRAQAANLRGRSPKPEDATKAILDALNRYEVVAMGAAHGNKDLDDFILHLVRDPAFPSKVNDLAVECGNSLYQPILDRYIAGGDVPLSEVRQVWRNTTQPMCGTSGFYEELSLWCAGSIRRFRGKRNSGCWQAILRLTGAKSRAALKLYWIGTQTLPG